MSKELNLFEAPLKGISLVEAGAGTGKTYNIVSLYVRVILEKGLMPANILVLTYTEAATAELKTRLRKRLIESIEVLKGGTSEDPFLKEVANRYKEENLVILQKALYSFDEAAVSTIHGFCQRILKEESVAFDVSADFEIVPDDSDIFQEQVDHFWRGFIAKNNSNFEQAIINFIYEKGFTPDKLSGLAKKIIQKPFASILPKTTILKEYEPIFESLKKSKNSLKKAFLDEEAHIIQNLQSDSLNKARYKEPEKLIEGLRRWLDEETSITPYDKLKLFGSFMNTEGAGLKKGKQISPLKIWDLVDEYLSTYSGWEEIEIAWLVDATKAINDRFKEKKRQKNILSYQDLLEITQYGLESGNSEIAKIISEKYPIALIDEFQDTDPIQYSIFSNIYAKREHTALFMIGDPKQAIYSFRGADIFTYLRAQQESSEDQRYSLIHNYRSSAAMINAVNEVFGLTEDSFVLDQINFDSAQFPNTKSREESALTHSGELIAPLQFVEIPSQGLPVSKVRKEISIAVANEILTLIQGKYSIDGERLTQKDVAVLVRTHDQALLIQQALSQKGLSSIIKSKQSVFHSPESGDLHLILSAILNPMFESGIRAALATEALGFSGQQILELHEDDPKWEKEYQKFIELLDIWKRKGINALFSHLNKLFSLSENYAAHTNAERRLTNLLHLVDLLSAAEQKNGYTPAQLLSHFRKKRGSHNGQSDDEILRLESDNELIQILTMHSSKGLEFPVVICPYLWEGTDTKKESIFSFNRNGESFLDVGTKEGVDENRIQNLTESLAEKVRLSYVSLTRAKSACFVILADGINSELSPLASLFEGSTKVLDRLKDKITLKASEYKSRHSISEYSLSKVFKELEGNLSSKLRKPAQDLNVLAEDSSKPKQTLQALEFHRTDLYNYSRIASFSSLVSGSDNYEIDYEKSALDYYALLGEVSTLENSNLAPSMFSLPKGAKTGTLLHEIFEEALLSTPNSISEIVTQKTQKFGFEEKWISTIHESVKSTLTYPLDDGILLKDIRKEDLLIEMEFHFPIENVTAEKLKSIIRGNKASSLELLNDYSGFMKGYIDLLFKHQEKYYILDYKSNHLGDRWEDYSKAVIQEEVLHSNYDLQYHIYCVAVHRMLKSVLPDYDYNTHFGGVFYLFLRGVNPDNPETGVFFSKPEASLVSDLDNYFISENHE